MEMLKQTLKTSASRLVRGSVLKGYVDKRLVNGLKVYLDAILCITTEPAQFPKPNLNKAISPVYQTKVERIISNYSKATGTEAQMKFMGMVVMTTIITELKLYEIATNFAPMGLEKFGISSMFLAKLQDGIDLIDAVDADFDAFLKKDVSKADLRYIEVGLKRLLDTEVDSIV